MLYFLLLLLNSYLCVFTTHSSNCKNSDLSFDYFMHVFMLYCITFLVVGLFLGL